MTSNVPPPLERNLLLRSLPPNEQAKLRRHAEVVTIARGEVLFEPGDDVVDVHFPLDGAVVALLIPFVEGRTIETATVGREGALGGVVSQGFLPAYTRAVVQMGGRAIRINAAHLQASKRGSPTIRNAFVRYADCLLAQVLQSVACNATHPIEQRSARWLLTLHDRLGTDLLPVTQDQLAEMLGVRRTYLSGILHKLQQQGLIDMNRARIAIRNRPALEAAACECHARVQAHYARVLGARFDGSGTLVALEPDEAPAPLRARQDVPA